MFFRTDLAQEAREYLGDKIDGIRMEEKKGEYLSVVRMHVDSMEAAEKIGKPVGTYITLELPPFSDDYREPEEKIRTAAAELSRLLPEKGLVLVAGLGNCNITPDNLGPLTAREVLATRHIRGELARSSGLDQLRPVAVIAPGVLGQTGIETGELIASLVKRLQPSAVIVVDALASPKPEKAWLYPADLQYGHQPRSGRGQRQAGDQQAYPWGSCHRGGHSYGGGRRHACSRLGRRRLGRTGSCRFARSGFAARGSHDGDSARS